jgi:diguanylate cyclase (GGDEF)-like protein
MARPNDRPTDGGALAERPRGIARLLVLALILSSVIPLVIAGYSLYAPAGDAGGHASELGWRLWWLGIAAVSTLMGIILLCRLVSAASRTVVSAASPQPGRLEPSRPAVASSDADSPPDPSQDDLDSLMGSLSRVLTTIEQQAAEVDQYAVRLDNAYKQIESSSAQLKEFSFKDEVTGLYNRRFFSIRLEEEVSRYRRFNHPVSVVLLDLDGFKAVNDELGHASGDETLRGMADILLKHSRGINVICRYGGDEFAVLLVETSKAGAWLYADRIRYVLPSYRFSHGRPVTASFGIASLPEDVAPSPEELIRAADEALYAAKRAGKNRVSVHGEGIVARFSADDPERE